MKLQSSFIDQTAIAFLSQLSIQQSLDVETRQRLNQKGELALDDADFYVKTNVTGEGGTIDLIKRSLKEKKGTVNIDSAALPPLSNLVLKKVRVAWAKDAAEEDPALVKFTNKVGADLDQALYGAKLIISQDNKLVFERPLSTMFAEETSRESASEGAYLLDNFRLIVADKPFEIKLEFPEGQSVEVSGTEQHHLEVRLIGSATRAK